MIGGECHWELRSGGVEVQLRGIDSRGQTRSGKDE